MQTLLFCLFGDTSLAHELGSKFSLIGYIFYYVYMIVSYFLLLNMLLAIVVDAYVSVKKSANSTDNVFVDMYKQVGGIPVESQTGEGT